MQQHGHDDTQLRCTTRGDVNFFPIDIAPQQQSSKCCCFSDSAWIFHEKCTTTTAILSNEQQLEARVKWKYSRNAERIIRKEISSKHKSFFFSGILRFMSSKRNFNRFQWQKHREKNKKQKISWNCWNWGYVSSSSYISFSWEAVLKSSEERRFLFEKWRHIKWNKREKSFRNRGAFTKGEEICSIFKWISMSWVAKLS